MAQGFAVDLVHINERYFAAFMLLRSGRNSVVSIAKLADAAHGLRGVAFVTTLRVPNAKKGVAAVVRLHSRDLARRPVLQSH